MVVRAPGRGAWRIFRRYVGPLGGRVALLGALLAVTTTLQVSAPQILRRFLDGALSGAATADLATLAAAFLAVGVGSYAVGAVSTVVAADVGWTATNRLRADLALHCLRLDMGFHNAHRPGELVERVDGDVNALATFFSALVVRVFGSVLLIVGVVGAVARENMVVGVAFAATAILLSLVLARLRSYSVPTHAAEREATAQVFGFIEERLAGIEDVRANGGGGATMRGYARVAGTLVRAGVPAWMRDSWIWFVTIGTFTVLTVIAMAGGASLFLAGSVSVGTVYLLVNYAQMLIEPFDRLVSQLQEFQRAVASIGRIEALFAEGTAIDDGPGVSAEVGPLSVTFDHVSFTYPDDVRRGSEGASDEGEASADSVLRDVNFHLESGRSLGVLGRTGSGKTTVARLLVRLFDPTAGVIRLGGDDVRWFTLDDLRRRVVTVSQEVQIFSGTLRDNLTLFDNTVPDARIDAVLAELDIVSHAWFQSLAGGLDAEIGPRRRDLSAGEAQMVSLARAFLADPSVVILDEASARLDPATERVLDLAIDRLLRNRTAIVIAHRLATLDRVTDVLVMEGGTVAEWGPRDALASDPQSRYARLRATSRADAGESDDLPTRNGGPVDLLAIGG
jgi:ATP-binding cassette subfamily B protein